MIVGWVAAGYTTFLQAVKFPTKRDLPTSVVPDLPFLKTEAAVQPLVHSQIIEKLNQNQSRRKSLVKRDDKLAK
jgi:hypothetical protein